MRQLRAMMKKELFEQLKTHRLVVMLLLFTLVGVLSPAFAKMTPWLLDLVSGRYGRDRYPDRQSGGDFSLLLDTVL